MKMKQINHALFDLFISDIHLCVSRPHITASFLDFLKNTASHARSLYILGDLFEYWAGDDDLLHPDHAAIITGLAELSKQGTALYIMHGNRDFLLGETFCKATGATLLTDPSCVRLFNQNIVLSHGDDLCKDDVAYMEFKAQVRNPAWINTFLSQPLNQRKAYIASVRARSEQDKKIKSSTIMDVNQDAVIALLTQQHLPDAFIHGHTHRPNTHTHTVALKTIKRFVLGDWYEQGSYLKISDAGIENRALSN